MPSQPEVWLRTNRRALVVAMVLPGLMLAAALAAIAWSLATHQPWLVSSVLAIIIGLLVWLLWSLFYASTLPRIAYEAGDLLVYAEVHRPTRVPLDIVEVFFLGQGPSELPKLKGREPETQNVIIRLAESATEWKHREMKPGIGLWCEGYITIRGSWCEPITPEIMRRLNHRLAEIQRERKAAKEVEGAAP